MRLVSPNGTVSNLLKTQQFGNFYWNDFPVTTSRFWGEDPAGTWTLQIRDANSSTNTMQFNHYDIELYGTTSGNEPQFTDISLQHNAPSAVDAGQSYTHTLTLSNVTSTPTRNGFSMDVTLPAGVILNSASVDNGGTCTGTVPNLTCTWTTSSFSTATVNLNLTALYNMTPGTYTTTATATLAEANDLNTLNNVYLNRNVTYNSSSIDPDVNTDGIVSPTDAVYVINRLNSGDLSADVDGDGDVDLNDLQIVLNHLGN
jgi:hypothetical protein